MAAPPEEPAPSAQPELLRFEGGVGVGSSPGSPVVGGLEEPASGLGVGFGSSAAAASAFTGGGATLASAAGASASASTLASGVATAASGSAVAPPSEPPLPPK